MCSAILSWKVCNIVSSYRQELSQSNLSRAWQQIRDSISHPLPDLLPVGCVDRHRPKACVVGGCQPTARTRISAFTALLTRECQLWRLPQGKHYKVEVMATFLLASHIP